MAENIIIPRRREDFFDEEGEPTLRFVNWIELVTGQTNVTSIVVEDTEQELTSIGSRVNRNTANLNSIALKEFELITVTADLQTSGNQIIICRNSDLIEITLDPNAIEEDEVHIKRREQVVDVIGIVDGKTDLRINVKLFSLRLVFNSSEWIQI